MTISNNFEKGAKYILYLIAALLPVWFVPWPIGVEFGREITFVVLGLAAALLWLLSVLTTGSIRYQHSPLSWISVLLVAVFGMSTALSKAPAVSAFLADPIAEKFTTLVLGLLLMVLVGSVFRSRDDAGNFVLVLLVSGAVSALLSILQLVFNVSLYGLIAPFAAAKEFHAIGTVNGAALFYGALLAMTAGLLASNPFGDGNELRRLVRWMLYGALLVFTVYLFLINFLTAWIVLFGSGIFLFGFMFRKMFEPDAEGKKRGMKVDSQYAMALALLALSLVMLFIRQPVLQNLNIPAEVSPSFRATVNVAKEVFQEGPKNILLGSGPALFGLDWARYRDSSINQTIFWQIRFNQGFSWAATLLSTTGVLGATTFLLFVGASFFLFLKHFIQRREVETALATSVFLGFVSVALIAFLYPANFTFILLLFILAGILSHLLAFTRTTEQKGFWVLKEKEILFNGPWSMFLSSLVSIFLIALGIAGLSMHVGKFRAALAQEKGIRLVREGKIADALPYFTRAAQLEDGNFRHYDALVQVRMEKVRSLIQEASNGKNVQQEFQGEVALAIQDSQRAIQLFPEEPILWRTQGALYELIVPFIQGSEKFAADSYRKVAELDPSNPVLWVDLARTNLLYVDRLQALINQSSGVEREELEGARVLALEEAMRSLEKAVAVKSDFAAAHFLMTQAALRLGDVRAAIRSAENAKFAAPFDIGVAFQLGLLYYQNGELAKAETEFTRAVSINTNYSNARYFLGLIHDRRGEKEKALAEFEQIEALNPDNEEIKQILTNLRAGKQALTNIVPPASPPERRQEAPISDTETQE